MGNLLDEWADGALKGNQQQKQPAQAPARRPRTRRERPPAATPAPPVVVEQAPPPVDTPVKRLNAQPDEVVFYRGERWWVDALRGDNFVSLRDHKHLLPKCTTVQCVPAALCTKHPVQPRGITAPMTQAALAARERKIKGQHDVGDQVAEALRGKSIEEVYRYAGHVLGVPPDELATKYEHLDNGRRRMVVGNRLRAALKRDGGNHGQ